MEYNKEDLKAKKLDELKTIARNLNISTTGKKQDLIERIINQRSYFDILPKDILNIVDDYKIYNNKNNQFLMLLLDIFRWGRSPKKPAGNLPPELQKYSVLVGSLRYNGNWVDIWAKKVNKLFIENKIDVQFILNGKDNTKFEIEIRKIPFINNDLMAKILLAISKDPFGEDNLNKILYGEDMNFGVVKFFTTGKDKTIVLYGGKRLIQ